MNTPAGHVSSRGWWHPGRADVCPKCDDRNCGFTGTDAEVDEHRSLPGVHDDQPQAGSSRDG